MKFVNLGEGPWSGAQATVESIDGNTFWFRRDDGGTGNLMRGNLERYTKLTIPFFSGE